MSDYCGDIERGAKMSGKRSAESYTERLLIPMDENKFQKICLVSSAAFNAASCVWSWTAPIGAALGLYASIDTEHRPELESEFRNAVDIALEKTKNDLTTIDSIKIINELSSSVVRPDNLDELISKTETYRSQYCTVREKKRIVEIFDGHFKEELCKCESLSNYYLLTAGAVTLKKIKYMNEVLVNQRKKLSDIERNINEINHKTTKILTAFRTLLNECGFVLIAVAGCLFMGLHNKVNTPFFYIHVIVCYMVSSLFTSCILKTVHSHIQKKKHRFKLSIAVIFTIESALIYTAISIGVYLIIVASQPLVSQPLEQSSEVITSELLCVLTGCVVNCVFRTMSSSELFDLANPENL